MKVKLTKLLCFYIGEHVGAGGPEVDIAVDPIEGTNLIAKGQNGAIAVMAIAEKVVYYMHQICTWRNFVLVLAVQVLSILQNL